jgi:hypothetical protein
MRALLLSAYCWVTNYRFRRLVTSGLKPYYTNLTIDVIRAKAGASLTSVSAFLAFAVAVLPFLASMEFNTLKLLFETEKLRHEMTLCTTLAIFLPYSSFWLERHISAVSVETSDARVRKTRRFWRSSFLILSLVASLLLFLAAPQFWPSRDDLFKLSFVLAGAVMVVLSVVFLLFALEFYDSAAGWRGNVGLHFHLAGIASNSYVFGVSLTLMGASLTVCASHLLIGRLLASGTLAVLVGMTEIERALWDLSKE